MFLRFFNIHPYVCLCWHILAYGGASLLIWGPSWLHLGLQLGHLGSILALSWAMLGSYLAHLGSSKASRDHLGCTLFQGWLPSGLQSPSRIDFGEVLGPFWDHVRQFFKHMFSDFWKHSLAACCKQKRSKSQGNTKRMQQKASKKQLLSSRRLALKSSLANVNELSGPR